MTSNPYDRAANIFRWRKKFLSTDQQEDRDPEPEVRALRRADSPCQQLLHGPLESPCYVRPSPNVGFIVGQSSSGLSAGHGALSLKLGAEPGIAATAATIAESVTISVRRF